MISMRLRNGGDLIVTLESLEEILAYLYHKSEQLMEKNGQNEDVLKGYDLAIHDVENYRDRNHWELG